MFAIGAEAIIYFPLYNVHDCTFKNNDSIEHVQKSFLIVLFIYFQGILAQALYTLVKRSPLNCKFLRLSSGVRIKIRQISPVNFEMASQFLLKFCIMLHCHDT